MSDYDDDFGDRHRKRSEGRREDGSSSLGGRSRAPLLSQNEAFGKRAPTREERSDRGVRGDRGDRFKDEPPPELYSIHKGRVASIQPFGFFCALAGFKRQGLVHVSQMSNYKVENPGDVVEAGESVYVKVIKLGSEEEGFKMSLSMKYAGQSDGKDLDPNNVQLMQASHQRKPPSQESRRIELGAVLNTVCTKCGSKGHLAIDCFGQKGGAKYDLVDSDQEDDYPRAIQQPPLPPPAAEVKSVGSVDSITKALKILRKQEKREKKRKEKKERKEHRKKRKEKKEKREKRKKKRSSSGSDSDSDSSTSSSDSDSDSDSGDQDRKRKRKRHHESVEKKS